MADEQLYGREGIEASQGFVPMPEPVTDKPDPELEQAQAIERIIDRDPPSPIIERAYQKTDGPDRGEHYPDQGTVSAERAARELADVREAEAALAEMERDAVTAVEIDLARHNAQPQPEAQQTESQPVAQPQQQNAPADVDPELQSLLSNPKILSALTDHYSAAQAQVAAAQTQAEAQTSAAIQQAADWSRQNAEFAAAAILARPELQGIPAAQLPGALKALATANPQAAAQIQQQLTQVQILAQQAQQAQQVAHQRAQQQFAQVAAQHDAAFDQTLANETPETRTAIKQGAMQLLVDSGMTPEQIQWNWNNSGLLRSFAAQSILADAARFRLNKAAIANKVSRPVPQVNRPGSSVDRPDAASRDSFALEQRYQGDLNVKQAAQLLQGRRARSR